MKQAFYLLLVLLVIALFTHINGNHTIQQDYSFTLTIKSINGSENFDLKNVPVGSTLTVEWSTDNEAIDEDDVVYLALRHPLYSSLPQLIPNIPISLSQKTFKLDVEPGAEAYHIELYSDLTADPLAAPVVLTLVSLCQDPLYCGDATYGHTCDAATSQCQCAAGWSGKYCQYSPCATLGCNEQSTQECSETSPKCVCKPGYSGEKCDAYDECNLVRSCGEDGGYVKYTTNSTHVICSADCACPSHTFWADSKPESSSRGCNKCNMACYGASKPNAACTACECPLGYSGLLCDEHQAYARVSFLESPTPPTPVPEEFNITATSNQNEEENDGDNDYDDPQEPEEPEEDHTGPATSRAMLRLLPAVLDVEPSHVKLLESYKKTVAAGTLHHFVFGLTYTASTPQTTSQSRHAALLFNTQQTQQQKQLFTQWEQFRTAHNESPETGVFSVYSEALGVPQPLEALYAPSCSGDSCPTGVYPFEKPQVIDRSSDDPIRYTIVGIACGFVVLALIFVFVFHCFGRRKHEDPLLAKNDNMTTTTESDAAIHVKSVETPAAVTNA